MWGQACNAFFSTVLVRLIWNVFVTDFIAFWQCMFIDCSRWIECTIALFTGSDMITIQAYDRLKADQIGNSSEYHLPSLLRFHSIGPVTSVWRYFIQTIFFILFSTSLSERKSVRWMPTPDPHFKSNYRLIWNPFSWRKLWYLVSLLIWLFHFQKQRHFGVIWPFHSCSIHQHSWLAFQSVSCQFLYYCIDLNMHLERPHHNQTIFCFSIMPCHSEPSTPCWFIRYFQPCYTISWHHNHNP